MIARCLIAAGISLVLGASAAVAQTCGGIYQVKRGDSLSVIADSQYKDAKKWTVIHQGNTATIGQNPNSIRVGQKLRLTCINGLPTGLEGGQPIQTAAVSTETPAQQQQRVAAAAVQTASTIGSERRKLLILTGDDYYPFSDRDHLNGGMITDIVNNAMDANPNVKDFGIFWSNDWNSHLNQLLPNAIVDMSFPWLQPDCEALPDHERCRFLYSDPMFELLVLLFTDKSKPFKFESDSDILGKTLCRPTGYSTHIFEKDGRNWVKDGKITLKQPSTLEECFEMLLDGTVDAVGLNEFTGRTVMKSMDIIDKINVVSSRPLSIEGLHVIVHKEHPKAAEMIDVVNESLGVIQASGQYQRVLDAQMSKIWESF